MYFSSDPKPSKLAGIPALFHWPPSQAPPFALCRHFCKYNKLIRFLTMPLCFPTLKMVSLFQSPSCRRNRFYLMHSRRWVWMPRSTVFIPLKAVAAPWHSISAFQFNTSGLMVHGLLMQCGLTYMSLSIPPYLPPPFPAIWLPLATTINLHWAFGPWSFCPILLQYNEILIIKYFKWLITMLSLIRSVWTSINF